MRAAASRGVAGKISFVAGDAGKHDDAAMGFGPRCRAELHARRCHPRVRGVEVLDVQEGTHPACGLFPDDGDLAVSVSPGEQQARRRPWRPGC